MRLTGGTQYIIILLLILSLTPALHLSAGDAKMPALTRTDKCPVCGMFVYKYPDWTGHIIFKDGSYAVFDGAKDLFKYYMNPKRYNSSKASADISSIHVTDYYSLKPIDALKALYVVGSDVYGPMGRELIPFSSKDDAKEFMKDHGGKAVLEFGNVNAEIIKELDR
ncbi:MAG TPA: nitrous oxide reductase accessory protein NosL [Syntrophorhabdaceae bacterium]|nr:nitrous oxide reductase accessory protein NosL [Syntrophorhabdaceae bacterium]